MVLKGWAPLFPIVFIWKKEKFSKFLGFLGKEIEKKKPPLWVEKGPLLKSLGVWKKKNVGFANRKLLVLN